MSAANPDWRAEKLEHASIDRLIELFEADGSLDFIRPVIQDLWQEAKAAGISLKRFRSMRAAEIHQIFLARRTVAGTKAVSEVPDAVISDLLGAKTGGRPVGEPLPLEYREQMRRARGNKSVALVAQLQGIPKRTWERGEAGERLAERTRQTIIRLFKSSKK